MSAEERGVRRFGMAARLVPAKREEYLALHADVWPQVEATITQCGIRNFTIFVLDDVILGYYEYVGDDWAADMEDMKHDLKNQEWWAITVNMQYAVPDAKPGELWTFAKEVFHTD